MKKIIVAGFYRTGSTLQYNIIRCTLEEAGKSVYGAWIEDYDPTNPAEYHVIKTHTYNEELFSDATVFVTYRRYEDVVKSIERVGLEMDAKEAITYFKNNIVPYINHSWDYDEMMYNNKFRIWELLELFNVPITSILVERIMLRVRSIVPPARGKFGDYDKVTLLHPNHIISATSLTKAFRRTPFDSHEKTCKSCKNCKCK
jgi:hypothetical protein